MRLVSSNKASGFTLGVRLDDEVVDLSVAAPDGPQDLLAVIAGGAVAFQTVEAAAAAAGPQARVPFEGLEFGLPIPSPPKILCLGLNYADHAAEGGVEPPSYPTVFMRGRTSLVAHRNPIVRPRISDKLDYEAELVAVIGTRIRHASEANALGAVAGYSNFNDASIRDYQRKTPQWTVGKNFDSTGGFGPEFVTADELPPGASGLDICSRLNGEVMQQANTRDMIFPVAKTIELLSACMTLEPGDLLVMGTPAGVGFARNPPLWMKDGDTIEVEIEGIGILSNPIKDES